jgi:hypothetical protein
MAASTPLGAVRAAGPAHIACRRGGGRRLRGAGEAGVGARVVAYSEQAPDGAPVTASRIVIGAARRDKVAVILYFLRPSEITTDAANGCRDAGMT